MKIPSETRILKAQLNSDSGFTSKGKSIRIEDQPYVIHNTCPVILNGPYLVAPSEEGVSIVWTTDTPCHSKVIWGEDECLSNFTEPQEHGLLIVGTLHTVRLTGLLPGKTYRYRVVSTGVVKLKPYWPEKGLAVESEVFSFVLPDRQAESVSFSFITDTQHEDVKRLKTNLDMVEWDRTEFLVHGGDALNWVENEEQIFEKWLNPMFEYLGHSKPLVYVRGNHDMRGPFAREVYRYVPTGTIKYYYTFDAGPIHFIVLDTGEDKDDDTSVYSDLNRFEVYREQEFSWLMEHVESSSRLREASFRVILMHGPTWGWVPDKEKWTALANRAKVDLVIAGHRHLDSVTLPRPTKNGFPIIVVGQDQVGFLEATRSELQFSVKDSSGELSDTLVLTRERVGPTPGSYEK